VKEAKKCFPKRALISGASHLKVSQQKVQETLYAPEETTFMHQVVGENGDIFRHFQEA